MDLNESALPEDKRHKDLTTKFKSISTCCRDAIERGLYPRRFRIVVFFQYLKAERDLDLLLVVSGDLQFRLQSR